MGRDVNGERPARWQLIWAGGSPGLAGRPWPDSPLIAADVDGWEHELGIAAKTPVLISPAFDFDARLVEFFTSGTFQGKSLNTRKTYGPEIRIWLDFLWPKEWVDADEDDVARFKAWRTDRALPPGPADNWADAFYDSGRRVSGATWDKGVAALNLLYDWAANPRRAHVPANPLLCLTKGRGNARTASLVSTKSKDARAHRYRWISPATYRLLIDVGVRRFNALPGSAPGKLAVGAPDPTHRARNIDRNRAAFDLAYFTGLRRSEFGALLVPEVPMAGLAAMTLADAVSKNNRGRSVLIPQEPISRIQDYVRLERRAAIANGQRRGLYDGPDTLVVEQIEQARRGSQRIKLQGGPWLDINDLDATDRARLLMRGETGLEPLWLFLTEVGSPLHPDHWQDPFVSASARLSEEGSRCGAWPVGKGLRVTPHSLRFSFALLYLMALHQAIDAAGVDASAPYDPFRYLLAYQRVQAQLGHASVGTTINTYLNPIQELRGAPELLRAHDAINDAMTVLSHADTRVLDLGS